MEPIIVKGAIPIYLQPTPWNLLGGGLRSALYAEYQERGGKVHPNGPLQTKPWGTKEFAAVDPNGVCMTIQE
jgi:hypothetical protein